MPWLVWKKVNIRVGAAHGGRVARSCGPAPRTESGPWPSARREVGTGFHPQGGGVCQQPVGLKEVPALDEKAALAHTSHAVPGLPTCRICEVVTEWWFSKRVRVVA